MTDEPIFFTSQAELREWLETHGTDAQELWIGFHKKAAMRPTLTPPQVLDAMLCYGWIDSVRRGINAHSYKNRYTPRTPKSNWSAVNIKRAKELLAQGLMRPAGLREFEKHDEAKADQISSERQRSTLDPADEAKFKEHPAAWEFFDAQALSYQRAAVWWVISAKKHETRTNRLTTLIAQSADGQRIPTLGRPTKPKLEPE